MIIFIDLTPIYDHLTGVERFAINITKNILICHPECKYVLLFKEEVHEQFQDIINRENIEYFILKKCNKLLFSQFRVLKKLYHIKSDAYVFMASSPPWFFWNKHIIYTQHDLSAWDCPKTRSVKNLIYAKFSIRLTLLKKPMIVTVSDFSRDRIVSVLKYDIDKISVVYNGLTDIFEDGKIIDSKLIKDKYTLPDDYILCLSTLEPRKNMVLLLKAFYELRNEKKIDCDLVLAGRKGWKLDDVLLDISPWNENVHVTGFVEDCDLPGLYKNATLFVFPSIYEGFGIPIIEALSQQTLVISSDAASLPEILGQAGVLFKNNNLQDLKDKIVSCLSMSQDEIEKYKKRGLDNIKRFDWQKESCKFFEVIRRIGEMT